MFMENCSNIFRKKSKWESRKLSFDDMLSPIAMYDEISCCKLSL
jgi:hypothetical protein